MLGEFSKMVYYFRKNNYKLFAMKILHLILTVVVFFISFLFFRYKHIVIEDYGYRYNYYAAFLYGVLIVFFYRSYNAYLLGYTRVQILAIIPTK